MRTYTLKEVFYTLQGEGAQAGRAAVFARFAGCNLWSGREEDRAAATCKFCDTDFIGTDGVGGGKFRSPEALAVAVRDCWDQSATHPGGRPYVVFTGGEPLLQLDADLVSACQARGVEVGVETNGTIAAPEGIDWICVSPKERSDLVQVTGDELKLVFPQGGDPEQYLPLEFSHRFLQPMDGGSGAANTAAALNYCRSHPIWRLSLQTHKMVGFP